MPARYLTDDGASLAGSSMACALPVGSTAWATAIKSAALNPLRLRAAALRPSGYFGATVLVCKLE